MGWGEGGGGGVVGGFLRVPSVSMGFEHPVWPDLVVDGNITLSVAHPK